VLVLMGLALFLFQGDSGHSVHDQPDYQLDLGGERFDPLVEFPFATRAATETGFHLVQLTGTTRSSHLQTFGREDLKIIRYIHPYTYIVWGDPGALQSVRGNLGVRWVGPFPPGLRMLPHGATRDSGVRKVRAAVYRGIDAREVREALEEAGAEEVRSSVLDSVLTVYSFSYPVARLSELAELPFVYTVQPVPLDGGLRGEMSAQVVARNLVGGVPQVGYQDWLTNLGLDGSGVLMANVDAGVATTHPDLINRFVPCAGVSCDIDDTFFHPHGTHTAGIMGGDGTSGVTDVLGFLRGLGVAPGALMVEQRYINNYQGEEGMRLLIRESHEAGATLSNNSWGPSSAALGYDLHTMEVDLSVRDADPNEVGNQPFHFVLAINNGNGGTSTQGTPDDAKNLLTVGSTLMQAENGQPLATLGNVSYNSAHGPARDGRLLPLIVAPGNRVDSPVNSTGYGLMLGTSMAAPHVTGASALFIEHYRNLTDASRGVPLDPSPELIKAALVIAAQDLAGGLDANDDPLGHRFDDKQGWGLLDLPAVFLPGTEVLYYDRERLLTTTGDTWGARLTVDDDTKPVKLMLAWTDAPGHGLGGSTPAWNNDLDLEVAYDGGTYLGNVIGVDGWSEPGGTADPMNNAEGVLLGPTATGELVVTVRGSNLTSDGVPGTGNLTDQDFALVCYNCVQGDDFTIDDGARELTNCGADEVSIPVRLTARGGFSDPVTLSVAGLPMGVTASFSENPLTPTGESMMTLSGLTGVVGLFPLTLEATSADWSDRLSLELLGSSGVPGEPELTQPLDGANRQARSPLLQWKSVPETVNYRVELADNSSFIDPLVTETSTVSQYAVTEILAYATSYYWRVTAINDCGDGMTSPTRTFETLPEPVVLLVDDDNNAPDSRAAYTTMLDYWGVSYDVYDTDNSATEPDSGDLSSYALVIWFSGNAFSGSSPSAGPQTNAEVALAGFLDGGGRLLISSQNYYQNMSLNDDPNGFMDMYLGLAGATVSVAYESVSGVGSLMGGLGPFDLVPGFTNRSDELIGKPDTEEIFEAGDGATAGLLFDHTVFTTVFLGFPLEGLSDQERLEIAPGLLSMLGIEVGNNCINESNVFAKLPFWPQTGVLDLVTCLNASQELE